MKPSAKTSPYEPSEDFRKRLYGCKPLSTFLWARVADLLPFRGVCTKRRFLVAFAHPKPNISHFSFGEVNFALSKEIHEISTKRRKKKSYGKSPLERTLLKNHPIFLSENNVNRVSRNWGYPDSSCFRTFDLVSFLFYIAKRKPHSLCFLRY